MWPPRYIRPLSYMYVPRVFGIDGSPTRILGFHYERLVTTDNYSSVVYAGRFISPYSGYFLWGKDFCGFAAILVQLEAKIFEVMHRYIDHTPQTCT